MQQYVAEFIGAFFLVFFGAGSMILAETRPGSMSGLVPLVWGGAVSIMIYAVGHISGAHFNPAVTLAFWKTRKFPGKRVFGYICAQIGGSVIAGLVHYFIWGGEHGFGETALSINATGGFMVEFIISFALMFVIISVATDTRAVGELAGIAIGSTVALGAFVGGPLTNASMNPARSIGPAVFTGNYSNLWLYILAPIAGAMAGAMVYEWIRCQAKDADMQGNEEEVEKHGCC